MSKREKISTRTRFEVFKRDGFRCVYCGATPMQSPLQVDHVTPVAEGGTDAPDNLVTACQPCNGGKSAVPLDRKALATTDAARLEAQREHLEQIREFLELQKQIDAAREEAADAVADEWEARIGPMSQDMYDRLPRLLRDWPIDRLFEAIQITADKMGDPGTSFSATRATKQAKYFHGILRKWRGE